MRQKINCFCAAFFVFVLSIILVFNGIEWYEGAFLGIKNKIEENFSVFPNAKIDSGFKKLFNLYMWSTNRKIINDVVVMNDGRLIFKQSEAPDSYKEKIDNIVALKDYLDSRNTPLLFVRVPDKMRDTSQLPPGYTNSILEDGVKFMTALSEKGVATLDLREKMMLAGMDFSTAFYWGDHHWTSETALWGFGQIASVMNADYGFSLDENTWNPQGYNKITYKNAFMGSESERIGDPSLKEDIAALIPKYDTQFKVSDINEAGREEALTAGSFIDVFVPKTKATENDSFSQYDLNAADSGFAKYVNQEADEHKKVLLIADSFGRVLSTYLACSTEQVYYLSLSESNNKKLYPVLENEDFDMVIFMVFDQVLLRDNAELGKDKMYFGSVPKYE